MFFCLDAKEPKNQDCQEKPGNSAARFTEILKLIPSTQYVLYSIPNYELLSARELKQ